MYAMSEWAGEYPAELIGITDYESINDDRIGRTLKKLFDADRSSLLTEIVVRSVSEFNLSMKRFHNDSTSVALGGIYRKASGNDIRSRRTINPTFGHSKVHRGELKQLALIFTVTGDGTVPVHYSVADGNTVDSAAHIETWESIRKLTGRGDFMYVADSKLCTPKMKTILIHCILCSCKKKDSIWAGCPLERT